MNITLVKKDFPRYFQNWNTVEPRSSKHFLSLNKDYPGLFGGHLCLVTADHTAMVRDYPRTEDQWSLVFYWQSQQSKRIWAGFPVPFIKTIWTFGMWSYHTRETSWRLQVTWFEHLRGMWPDFEPQGSETRYIGLIRFAFLQDYSGCFIENGLEGGKYGCRNTRGHFNQWGDRWSWLEPDTGRGIWREWI